MLKKKTEPDLAPPHPGEILREELLPRMAIDQIELARHLDIPARLLADLLAERAPVTVELAQKLGAAVGYGARYWLGLQIQHDLWRAETMPAVAIAPVRWHVREPLVRGNA